MNREAIRKMTQQERLQAMENLWDVLTSEGTEFDSPLWHQEILASRAGNLEKGNARFVPLGELKAEK